jgi:tetratricopeptide (TPR) repeat protein
MHYRKLSSLLAVTAISFALFVSSCAPTAVDTEAVFAESFTTEVLKKGELHLYTNRGATPTVLAEEPLAAVPATAAPTVPPLESELQKKAVKRMLENGMNSYNLKNYDQAIADFNNFLEVDADNKNNAEVKFYLGVSYLAKNQLQAAKELFTQLIKKDNKHSFRAEAEWYLALTLLKSRELDEAKKLLKDMAKDKKDHPYQAKAKVILAKIS